MLALIPLVLFPIIRHIIYPNEYNGQQICIVSENGKYHFVDLQNKKISTPEYDYIDQAHDGYYRYSEDDKWGYLNGALEEHIAAEYDACGNFHNDLAPVEKDNQWQYINRAGLTKIEGPFQWAGEFKNGKAIVKENEEMFIIDKKGNKLKGPFYSCDRLYEDAFYIRNTKESKPEVLDQRLLKVHWNGKAITDPVFLTEKTAALAYKKNGSSKCRLIDLKTGKLLLDHMDTIVISLDGKIICKEKNRWMFVNDKLQQSTYIDAEDLAANSYNLYPVKKDGLWGAVDGNGKMIIDPLYEIIGSFENGFASVKSTDGMWGVINDKGEIIIPCEYDFAGFTQ